MNDPLYLIFEQHLFTALVEDETTDEFLARVVTAYMDRLMAEGVVPRALHESLESDLRDEVLQMFRKKTYGYYNLASFREARGVELAPTTRPASPVTEKEKARRGGRAC